MPRRVTRAVSWPPVPDGKKHPVREDKYGRLWTRITRDGQEHLAVRLRDVVEDCRVEGSYDVPPARGKDDIDITAYHPHQQTWGFDRERRPEILFQYQRTEYQTSEVKALMDDDGNMVLDEDNHPIRHFPVLPLTISTAAEGFRLEAWHRMDSRIEYNDIRARMLVRWPASRGRTAPLVGSFNMRKMRARQTIRCLAWPRAGETLEKKGCFDMLLYFEMTDEMKAQNSTRLLTDLTSAEEKALSTASYGTGLVKAGNNALSQTQRTAKWQNAAALADKNGEIPQIDPTKYHQDWIRVRGFELPMILVKPQDDISEPIIQGPSTFQNPSGSSGHSMHGSQSVFPVDTRSAVENSFRSAQVPSSSHAAAYLGNLGTTGAQSSPPLSDNVVRHDGDQVIRTTSNDIYTEYQTVSADGPGYRPETFRETRPPNRALENGGDEGYFSRSISSGDDSGGAGSPNGVQQSKKRRRQAIDCEDMANKGSSTIFFNQHDLSMAVSPSHLTWNRIPRSYRHASHANTVASNKRQKVIASDTIQENMSNIRNSSTTQAVLQLVQGQRRPAVPRHRQEIAQGSRASVDSQVRARVGSSTLAQAGNHPTHRAGSPLYEQADHNPAYRANASGFNPAGGIPPHAPDARILNPAHLPLVHASNAAQFMQRGELKIHRPDLEYGNGSRNYAGNEAFPVRYPSRSPKHHMVDMLSQPIGQHPVGRLYASQTGYMSPLLSSRIEEPPKRQTDTASNEYISPPIPGQASCTDAECFEGMDPLEPWRAHEGLIDEVGRFSTDERRDPPPGKIQPVYDSLGYSTPHKAAGVSGFPRGDARNPLLEQHQFDDHGMFAAYTVDDDFTRVQTPDSSNIACPADPIIEGNLPLMEAHARGSSSTIHVEHSRDSHDRERVPRNDAEPAATVLVVGEVVTQSEELGQPYSAEAVTAYLDVERDGSMTPLDQPTNAGMWETAVRDEQSSVTATPDQRPHVGHDTGESSADQVDSTEDRGGEEEWNGDLRKFSRTPPPWNPEWGQSHQLPDISPLAPLATDKDLEITSIGQG